MSFMSHVNFKVFHKSEVRQVPQVRRQVANDDFMGLKRIFAVLAINLFE